MPDLTGIPVGGAPGGGMPPGLMGALQQSRPNIGPAPTAQGNPGNTMQAVKKIAAALEGIQQALQEIPIGSELHSECLKAAQQLSKALHAAGEIGPANNAQTLLQMARQAAQSAPQQAMQRLFPGQPSGGQPPPAAPPMPMAA